MKKQSFISSSFILIVSVILSKITGALFRIPLANMLGGTGMAYFGGAYGLFLPVYAVFVTGLSAASAKLTAESAVLYGEDGVRQVKKYSLLLFTGAGVAGTIIMLLLARPFSVYVAGSEQIYLSVLIIAPSVFFGCITAAYRGCAEGRQNMYPTAVSQIIESVVKLVFGLAICMIIIKNEKYFSGLFGEICDDASAVAAAGAVAGVTLSSFFGMLYMIFSQNFSDRKHKENGFIPCSRSGKEVMKNLVVTVVPVAVSALLTNLTSLVDLCTIMRYIDDSVKSAPEYFETRYSFINEIGTEKFSSFAYGAFSGMAVTIFNLVPSLTNMFGRGIFPAAAAAWAVKDTRALTQNAADVLKITSLVSVPAGLGICVMSRLILCTLFPSSANEAVFCVDSLRYLGIAVIFLCISFPVFSMLQAVGRADIPAKIMLAGVTVKLAGNMVLVRIPALNASGAAVSTGICYAMMLVMSLFFFIKHTKIRLNLFKLFYGPVYSGLMCMAAAWLIRNVAGRYADDAVTLVASVLGGGAVYLVFLFLLGEYKFLSDMTKHK